MAAGALSGRCTVVRPGVDDRNPAVLEVGAVTGGDRRIPRAGDGGDLAVRLQDRAANGAARGGYCRIGPGGDAVERQHAPRELLPHDGVDFGGEAIASLAGRQDRRVRTELRLADGGQVEIAGVLSRELRHDRRLG